MFLTDEECMRLAGKFLPRGVRYQEDKRGFTWLYKNSYTIFAPRPKDPRSLATFLHEVGHAVYNHKRCNTTADQTILQQEKEAWIYAVSTLLKECPNLLWVDWRDIFTDICRCLTTYSDSKDVQQLISKLFSQV